MPFLRAAQIKRERDVLEGEINGLDNSEVKEGMKEAVREMKKMNNLLHQLEVILAGI